MNKQSHPKILAVAICAALGTGTVAQAQETLEEVLVTGSKIRGAAIDRASPVNTLTAADL